MPIVTPPQCLTCKTHENVHLCKVCSQFTCWECQRILSDTACVHIKPVLGTSSSDWTGYYDSNNQY